MNSDSFQPTRVGDVYRSGEFRLSIEVFPPKTAKGDATLFRTLDALSRFRPAFVSCTYGAGGSTQSRTIEICVDIQKRYELTATSHFTCVGATRDEILASLGTLQQAGVHNIMALRGDPPEGQEAFRAVDGGLAHANELVELIRENFPQMGVGVAGYPEKHPEAVDAASDVEHLKRKVDAGADTVFTQLFFVNGSFLSFRERAENAGVQVPIVPGIMPVTQFARIQRITAMCGAAFPAALAEPLEAAQDDKEAQFEIGIEYAIRQCQELMEAGVPGIHFYALNKSTACERILTALGLESVAR